MPYFCLILQRGAQSGPALASDLPRFGFKPYVADSCEQALGILRQWNFDAALVDGAGFGSDVPLLLRRLQAGLRSPLLLLLEQAQDERQHILGLEAGATDIVVKPASAHLITAKLRRLIELAAQNTDADNDLIRLGPLQMQASRATCTLSGLPLKLTVFEFKLMFLLASRAGQFVDRETIAHALRVGPGEIGRSADVLVYRIRRKLKAHAADALQLETVYGRGYCLWIEGLGAADIDAGRPQRAPPDARN